MHEGDGLSAGSAPSRQALRTTHCLPERLVASWFLPGVGVAQHLGSGTSGRRAGGAEGW